MNTFVKITALALVAVGLAACKKDPPPAAPPPATTTAPAPASPAATAPAVVAVSVAGATLGTAVGADKKVTAATESFAKNDTIYVAVDTTGTGSANVKAKWTYFEKDGKPTAITEEAQTIQPAGPATTEFHVSKPDGWPSGNYQVEILLDNQVVQTKKFAVK